LCRAKKKDKGVERRQLFGETKKGPTTRGKSERKDRTHLKQINSQGKKRNAEGAVSRKNREKREKDCQIRERRKRKAVINGLPK